MKRTWVLPLGGFVVVAGIAAALGIWASGPSTPPMKPTTHYTSAKGTKITVTAPRTNAEITSPVQVVGQVPGLWSFEASFGASVVDDDHKPLGQHYAQVSGDWMTDKYVPFTASVRFKKPDSNTGFIVLEKANPEGGKRGADTVEIPVRFAD